MYIILNTEFPQCLAYNGDWVADGEGVPRLYRTVGHAKAACTNIVRSWFDNPNGGLYRVGAEHLKIVRCTVHMDGSVEYEEPRRTA